MTLFPLDALLSLDDVSFHLGSDVELVSRLQDEHGIMLPGDHWAALQVSNGIEAYAGHIRLFGVYTRKSIDAIVWNNSDYWKFAWGERCSGYWCFGETSWGDQYAYTLDSLSKGKASEVYFLDALSMTPTIVASSFSEFFEKEFSKSAKEPYDNMIIQARRKFGQIDVNSHLVYVPSVLLGGKEDINNVQKLSARSAMICNGDIAIQLDAGPSGRSVKGVQSYQDEAHRMRLRLVWE